MSNNVDVWAAYAKLVGTLPALVKVVKLGLALKGGWREAIVELEDHCSEPVRLRNMIAAADQLDDWATQARAVLANVPTPPQQEADAP